MDAKKSKKPRKIVFTEAIDSAINGYALGFSFIGIGVFLLLKPDYFFTPIASYIIGAVIGAFGVVGTGIELSKSSKIKGFDNLTMGLVFFAIWLVSYIKISTFWANLLFFAFLIFGAYAVCLGLFQSTYSIIQSIKHANTDANAKQEKGAIASQIVLFLTQICGLIVAILNVVKAVSV